MIDDSSIFIDNLTLFCWSCFDVAKRLGAMYSFWSYFPFAFLFNFFS